MQKPFLQPECSKIEVTACKYSKILYFYLNFPPIRKGGRPIPHSHPPQHVIWRARIGDPWGTTTNRVKVTSLGLAVQLTSYPPAFHYGVSVCQCAVCLVSIRHSHTVMTWCAATMSCVELLRPFRLCQGCMDTKILNPRLSTDSGQRSTIHMSASASDITAIMCYTVL